VLSHEEYRKIVHIAVIDLLRRGNLISYGRKGDEGCGFYRGYLMK